MACGRVAEGGSVKVRLSWAKFWLLIGGAGCGRACAVGSWFRYYFLLRLAGCLFMLVTGYMGELLWTWLLRLALVRVMVGASSQDKLLWSYFGYYPGYIFF